MNLPWMAWEKGMEHLVDGLVAGEVEAKLSSSVCTLISMKVTYDSVGQGSDF